jgi:multidrug resistance efflux pump
MLENFPEVDTLRARAIARHKTAQDSYSQAHALNRSVSQSSERADVLRALDAAQAALRAQASALKATGDFLAFVQSHADVGERQRVLEEHISEIKTATEATNVSLEKLERIRADVSGPSDAEITAAYMARTARADDARGRVNAAQADLEAARNLLQEYVVRAPTSGVLDRIDVQAGRKFLQGEILATIVSEQNVAYVGVGEKDIGSVYVGQKASVDFENTPGLTIEGVVIKVDPKPATADDDREYGVTVGFAHDEQRPKQGMSVAVHLLSAP